MRKGKLYISFLLGLCLCLFTAFFTACGKEETPPAPTLESISVLGETEVFIDEFEYADYTITATYSDNSTKTATLTADNLSADDNAKLSTVGTHSLTVSYESVTCSWTVTLKNHEFTGVTFDDVTTTYDGTAKTLAVSGLPTGANVSYDKETSYTNAGEYTVKATVTLANYNPVELTATLTIEKRELTLAFSGETTLAYNGNAQKTITAQATNLVGNDSVELTVSYNGEMIEAGDYIATATIATHQNYQLTKNNTVNVKITRTAHKVTFRQTGFADIVKEVPDLADLTDIPTPEQENGYTVVWEQTEFKTVTQDILVETIKTAIPYKIEYELNGGSNHADNPTSYTVESETLILKNPTKPFGSTFAGWYTTKTFTAESKITAIEQGLFGNKKLYAKWLDYRIENSDGFAIDYTQDTPIVSMKVPYATENIDLNSRFTVSSGCTWALYSDFMGYDKFPLKAMTLAVGNNQAYIIVNHPDGEHFTRYLLNIYRLDMKEYVFMDGLREYASGEIQEESTLTAPEPNPEKDGYSFAGWSVDGTIVSFPYTVLTGTVFTAEYTPIEYTVIFRGEKGNVINPERKYTIETGMTFEIPTRDYYEFTGWYESETHDGAFGGIDVGVWGDFEFYATWTPVVYDIDYELNGGSWTYDNTNPTTYTIETPTITLQSTVQKAGYTFKGWFTDSTFENQVTQIALGSHGYKKFYAKWEENTNTLKFDGNGATGGEMEDIKIKTTFTATLPECGFTKAGYTFIGYATSKNGSVVYNVGDTYTMGTNAEYTLYAKWTANLNTLKFDGNGATDGSMSETKLYTDETKALTENGFVRAGYTFQGWALTADGEVVFADKADYTMGVNAEYTLYAVWQANENTLKFISNGATGGETADMKIHTDETKALIANGFEKTGYTFIGWALTADGEVAFVDKANYTMGVNAEYTLYAKWEENTNTLKFDGNGATGGATSDIQIKTTFTATLPECGFTKAGYTFIGYATSKNGSVVYNVGDTYTMGTNAEYTLYAVWTANLNTLKFDGNGATGGSMSAMKLYTDETKALPENGFTCTGYVLAGWALTADGEAVYMDKADYTMGVNAEYTLYAVWVLNENVITFNGNGATSGEMSAQTVYNNGNRVLNENTFERNGYLFKGWALTADGEVKYLDGDTVNMTTQESYTLYAVWELITYNITYILDGGINNENNPTTYNVETSFVLQNPTRVGYTFGGWFTDSALENKVTGISLGSYINKTFYAKWLAIFTIDNGTITGLTAYGKNFYNLIIPNAIDGIAITAIADEVFYNCSNLTRIEIPDSVTSIGEYAFSNCSSLTSVYIKDVEAWCNISFGNAYANPMCYADELYINNTLITEELVIPNSVTSIGSYAFYNCSSLTSVVIGDNVTSIGYYAFYNCSSLTSVVIGDNVTSIGYYAFYNCSSLTSIELPDCLTSIGSSAFLNCSSLTSIEIPDSVTSIGLSAFCNCSRLESMTLPFVGESKTATGYKSVFGYIFGYRTAQFANSVSGATYQYRDVSLDGYYGYCHYYIPESLRSVTITGEVINAQAFYNCSNLVNVTIFDCVTYIGANAFYNCSNLKNVYYMGDIKGWCEIEKLSAIPTPYLYINNQLVTGELIIPTDVTSIGSYAFYDYDNLTSVVIPDSVTSIGEKAFYNCDSLTSVVIPDSVTSIGGWAFSCCSSLTSVVIGDSVTSIGDYAFAYCDNLTSVVIGDGVTSIGYYAFSGCDSLTSIKYCGTQAQWNAISKGFAWNSATGSYTITYNYQR